MSENNSGFIFFVTEGIRPDGEAYETTMAASCGDGSLRGMKRVEAVDMINEVTPDNDNWWLELFKEFLEIGTQEAKLRLEALSGTPR